MGYDGPQPGGVVVTTTGGERLAGGGNQNFLKQVLGRFKGGKAGGAGRLLSKAGLPLAGLSVLGSAMAAGQEFDGEGAGVDASQATGRFVGDLGTTAALAGLGTMIAPGVGTVALPVLGALLGVNEGVGKAGAGIGGSIYSALTGSTEDKARREQAKQARQNNLLIAEAKQVQGPIDDALARMADARALNMARQNAQIQSDYNFINSLDQMAMNRQANNAAALNLIAQELL